MPNNKKNILTVLGLVIAGIAAGVSLITAVIVVLYCVIGLKVDPVLKEMSYFRIEQAEMKEKIVSRSEIVSISKNSAYDAVGNHEDKHKETP